MNVLLLTNHLKDYAGSEIQILELYRYFKLKCNKVMVYANVIENPIAAYFDKCDLCSDAQQINPCDYEIIWSQHGVFSLLFDKEENSVFAAKIFSVHLSPFENMELLQLPYMNQIGAYFVANSLETKDRLHRLGVPMEKIHVSYNCAPSSFLNTSSPPQKLNRLVIISNHPPSEVLEASKILKSKIQVDIFGLQSKVELVTPELIQKYDVVLTIGKTVQYALLGNKLVYCYDHFGGMGYLSLKNYEIARYHNFSGRGGERKTADQIASEIINGFSDNRDFSTSLLGKEDYLIEYFMDKLLMLPSQNISAAQQLLIKQFVPIERKIRQLYLSHHAMSCTMLELELEFKLKLKAIKKRNTLISIFFLLCTLVSIFFFWLER